MGGGPKVRGGGGIQGHPRPRCRCHAVESSVWDTLRRRGPEALASLSQHVSGQSIHYLPISGACHMLVQENGQPAVHTLPGACTAPLPQAVARALCWPLHCCTYRARPCLPSAVPGTYPAAELDGSTVQAATIHCRTCACHSMQYCNARQLGQDHMSQEPAEPVKPVCRQLPQLPRV